MSYWSWSRSTCAGGGVIATLWAKVGVCLLPLGVCFVKGIVPDTHSKIKIA